MEKYKQNLKKYREMHRLTQAEMAQKLGLKSSQAYQYYEEKKLTENKAIHFSKILNYNITDKDIDLTPAPDRNNDEFTKLIEERYKYHMKEAKKWGDILQILRI